MPHPHKSVTATPEKSLVLLFIHKPKHLDELIGEYGTHDENEFWSDLTSLMDEHIKQPHCQNCGSTNVAWENRILGARDSGTGVPLEPDDLSEWRCSSCGSNSIHGNLPCQS